MKHRCREVTRIVLAGEDRPLSFFERLSMRTHLWICDNCMRFHGQVTLMREAMRRWRLDQQDGGDAEPVSPAKP